MLELNQVNVEKLMKMAGAVRIGGKGSVGSYELFTYKKKKAVHKTTSTDEKRLHSTLKRLGVNGIPQIEEVNIIKYDKVIQSVIILPVIFLGGGLDLEYFFPGNGIDQLGTH
ncbi:hypothetical protein L1987_01801 [Smallanthus sonchifolius]|uniref:Uncharacterized protein n=1 Tax=Smallanthus sonchifolius TaxID=185202 RepID=A0ACB9K617_9ASTR|nr:hypothetical protein L1987_01801 [Smallanthus sonchifolius]